MLFQIAVLYYFDSFDKKLPVKVSTFCKAATSNLQNIHTYTVDIMNHLRFDKENS